MIRSIQEMAEQKGALHLEHTAEVLEHLSQTRGIKDEELEVIGEILSNVLGALEVSHAVQNGIPKNDALNSFMKRVMGSIDQPQT